MLEWEADNPHGCLAGKRARGHVLKMHKGVPHLCCLPCVDPCLRTIIFDQRNRRTSPRRQGVSEVGNE